jgi:hypothetical protein
MVGELFASERLASSRETEKRVSWALFAPSLFSGGTDVNHNGGVCGSLSVSYRGSRANFRVRSCTGGLSC